jgi:hypothetical protein
LDWAACFRRARTGGSCWAADCWARFFLFHHQHRILAQRSGIRQNARGLDSSLTTGLPNYPSTWEFFRNTLLSGGLFTGLFVGAMNRPAESPAEKTAGVREPETETEPEEAGGNVIRDT